MREPLHNIRLEVLHTVYADIARQHFADFQTADEDLSKARAAQDDEAADSADAASTRAAISCIVFSALALEAQIFDFAARYLDDDYVASHLDKLDLVSKWVVIPLLVTGKQIDKGGAAYCHLRETVQARNRLVHYKSHGVLRDVAGNSDFNKSVRVNEENDAKLRRAAKAAKEGLELLLEELYIMSRDDFVLLSMSESARDKYRLTSRDEA